MSGLNLAVTSSKIVAVADIGSASAAIAFIELHGSKPAQVLVLERAILPIEERTPEATIAAIGEHLMQAGDKAMKAYALRKGVAIQELFCVIHAPWSRSVTAQASAKYEQDTKITGDIVGALAKEALGNQSEVDAKKLLEATVVRVELNGYPSAKPEGKLARELVVWALVSECDPALKSTVQASLQKIFPQLTPAYRSATRAILSMVRERTDVEKDYLVVDVVGESTTLVVVRNGAIAEQHVVPEGVRSILKRITPSGMVEETLSLVRMLERGQCSSAACENIQAAMAKVEPDLVRVFGEGMSACAAKQRLPNKLLLIVQPDILFWLGKFFARIDFNQFTLTTQQFSVETVAPKNLSPWIVSGHGALLDIGVALSGALVNREKSV